MLTVKLNENEGIAILEPVGALSEDDLKSAAAIIDPFIENSGKLNGIVVHVKTFPGWDSFSALIAHLKFIEEHHKKMSHVALVTNSSVGVFAEHVASHFINAEIKRFPFSELENSIKWISGNDNK